MPHTYGQVEISWNANSEANLAGYRIYYGTSPVTLNFSVNVGLTATPSAPRMVLTDFQVFGTLYFAVTAYNTFNLESTPSTPTVSLGVAPKLMPLAWG